MKTFTCINCKSTRCAEILYGRIPETEQLRADLKSGKVVLGGCIVSQKMPNRRCLDCGRKWIYENDEKSDNINQISIDMLEKMRLDLQKLHRSTADMQECLDRNRKQSLEKKAKAEAQLKEAEQVLAKLSQKYNAYLNNLRENDSDTLKAWVNLHISVTDLILNTEPPKDFGRQPSKFIDTTRRCEKYC